MIAVGKRPRGIHRSPDGKQVYAALTGTPLSAPPQLDARGNPVFKKGDDDDERADKSADDIGVTDAKALHCATKISAGSDPAEFAVSPNGKYVIVSNEDTKSAVDAGSYAIVGRLKVEPRPRAVAFVPGADIAFVPPESVGKVNVIDTSQYRVFEANREVKRIKVEKSLGRDGRKDRPLIAYETLILSA